MTAFHKCIFTSATILTLIFCTSCQTDENYITDDFQTKIELLEQGKWVLKDFENNVMYAFSNGERATYYGEKGEFPDTPIPEKHTYSFQDNKITLDLNFGNVFTYELKFSCNNNILEFFDDKGKLNTTLYRKDSNYQTCL